MQCQQHSSQKIACGVRVEAALEGLEGRAGPPSWKEAAAGSYGVQWELPHLVAVREGGTSRSSCRIRLLIHRKAH